MIEFWIICSHIFSSVFLWACFGALSVSQFHVFYVIKSGISPEHFCYSTIHLFTWCLIKKVRHAPAPFLNVMVHFKLCKLWSKSRPFFRFFYGFQNMLVCPIPAGTRIWREMKLQQLESVSTVWSSFWSEYLSGQIFYHPNMLISSTIFLSAYLGDHSMYPESSS